MQSSPDAPGREMGYAWPEPRAEAKDTSRTRVEKAHMTATIATRLGATPHSPFCYLDFEESKGHSLQANSFKTATISIRELDTKGEHGLQADGQHHIMRVVSPHLGVVAQCSATFEVIISEIPSNAFVIEV